MESRTPTIEKNVPMRKKQWLKDMEVMDSVPLRSRDYLHISKLSYKRQVFTIHPLTINNLRLDHGFRMWRTK